MKPPAGTASAVPKAHSASGGSPGAWMSSASAVPQPGQQYSRAASPTSGATSLSALSSRKASSRTTVPAL
jgi:hypothetical protein